MICGLGTQWCSFDLHLLKSWCEGLELPPFLCKSFKRYFSDLLHVLIFVAYVHSPCTVNGCALVLFHRYRCSKSTFIKFHVVPVSSALSLPDVSTSVAKW